MQAWQDELAEAPRMLALNSGCATSAGNGPSCRLAHLLATSLMTPDLIK